MSLITPWYVTLGQVALKRWRWIVYPGVIIFVFLFGYCRVQSCRQQNQKDKELELRDDENRQKGQLDILRELEANANIIVEQSGNNSNRANANLDAIERTDSNKFSANYRDAKRKYCADNPTDSACQ